MRTSKMADTEISEKIFENQLQKNSHRTGYNAHERCFSGTFPNAKLVSGPPNNT